MAAEFTTALTKIWSNEYLCLLIRGIAAFQLHFGPSIYPRDCRDLQESVGGLFNSALRMLPGTTLSASACRLCSAGIRI
jgi:hypothetical protein